MKKQSARRRATPSRARVDASARLALIQWNEQGLVPAVIQDARSKRVLTLCYLNREALAKSLQESNVYVYRRSQQRLMLKGETSGHTQRIRSVAIDCEGRSLVIGVAQRVAACHAGYFSCYFRRLDHRGRLVTAERRVFNPRTVYQR